MTIFAIVSPRSLGVPCHFEEVRYIVTWEEKSGPKVRSISGIHLEPA